MERMTMLQIWKVRSIFPDTSPRDFTTNIPVVVMNREDGYKDNMLPVDGQVLVNYMGRIS